MTTLRGSVPVTWRAGYTLDLPAGDTPVGGWPLLVLLHGYGQSGAAMAERLDGFGDAPYARLWPDAPFPIELQRDERRVVGHAWYQYTGDQDAFVRALDFGRAHLRTLLDSVAADHCVDPSRAMLCGYSQGGYLAGVAAFKDRDRWCGLVAIATRVKTEVVATELASAKGFPALLLHGSRDCFIDADRQRESAEVLAAHGVDVRLEVWDGGHGLKPALVPMIDTFVRSAL
ncbi:MAG: hypothetical protein CMJ83_14155 [Planctomycetes bacterium]|nr:hypothetical protein [Planctomycetota bacterium]